jgi:hypothetical protein
VFSTGIGVSVGAISGGGAAASTVGKFEVGIGVAVKSKPAWGTVAVKVGRRVRVGSISERVLEEKEGRAEQAKLSKATNRSKLRQGCLE